MILKDVRKNIFKSYLVVSIFIVVIIGIVYLVLLNMDFGFYSIPIAIMCGIVPAIISYFTCDKIVLSLNKARPASKEEDLELNSILDGLCIASGLPKPKLYVVDDISPNAFATGRNPNNSVICVTTGLLQLLDKYELEGVLAHELSHIRNYDILLSTIVSVFVGFIVILADYSIRWSWFRDNDNDSKGGLIMGIITVVLLILSPIFANLMQLAISRRREFLADATSVEFTRNPSGLISALQKLDANTDQLKNVNTSTSHMYIANPIKKKKKGISVWSTHPAIEDRIKALESIQ